MKSVKYLLPLLAAIALGACNTTQGLGEDIEAAGDSLGDAARETQEEIDEELDE